MAARKSILVFASGLGGLTVYREIAQAHPGTDFLYVADDAAFPYGALKEAALIERVVGLMGDLIEAHRSSIVFANSRRLAERLTSRLNEIHAERAGIELSLDRNPQVGGGTISFQNGVFVVQASHAFAGYTANGVWPISVTIHHEGAPDALAFSRALPAGAVVTIGVPIGAAVIVLSWFLTGLYVYRANTTFDALNEQILSEARQ